MGSSEKFCLRWNDFESNISGAFRELREDKDFFDPEIHANILDAVFRFNLQKDAYAMPIDVPNDPATPVRY